MYCAVLLLADGTYDREFIDYLPTSKDIRDLEDEYSLYVHNPSRVGGYGEAVRKPATIINLFKIGDSDDI